MSYIERKRIRGKIYLYFVKKIHFMKKLFVIKNYIGLASDMFSKEKYILDNITGLSNQEFKFKATFLDKIQKELSYNQNLPKEVEFKSIKINNLIEGKQCKLAINTEFAEQFIFNSNNIEGSRIPPEKVKEIIERGDTKYSNRNEIREVQNSILAFEYLQKDFKFNLISIKRLYHLLTKKLYMPGNVPYPRGFKKEKIIVGNSQTTDPQLVEYELKNLLKWYKDNKKIIHPLILAFEFHRRYEFIHPFRDANGRTGRLIMNKVLMNAGYPPIVVYKENKEAYFNAIEKSLNKKPKNYYHFMLEQSDKTYDYLLQTIGKY